MNRKLLLMSVSLLIAITVNAWGTDYDYYLEVLGYNAGTEVTVNGFSVFKADPNTTSGSRSTTRWLTPNMVIGDNVIEVSYLTREDADADSGVELKISSCVHGSARSTGTVLLDERIGSESLSIETLDPNSLTLLNGSISEDGHLVFEDSDVSGIDYVWRVRLDSDVIKLKPTGLVYINLSEKLKNGRVRFEKGQTYPLGGPTAANYIEFNFSELQSGLGNFEFDEPNSSSGDASNFNTFTIYGEVDGDYDPNDPVTCANFQINQVLLEDVEKTQTLTLTSGSVPTWSWQSGADISSITQSQEDDLWDTIVSIRSIMDNATDPNDLLPVFEKKTLDYSKALYKSNAEVESGQLSFFEVLLADSNWGMKTISRNNFKYYNINDKIIKVEKLDGSELLETNILNSGPANNRPLKIPLYFSLISNEWEIIK